MVVIDNPTVFVGKCPKFKYVGHGCVGFVINDEVGLCYRVGYRWHCSNFLFLAGHDGDRGVDIRDFGSKVIWFYVLTFLEPAKNLCRN